MLKQPAAQSQFGSRTAGWDALFASVDELARRRPCLLETDVQKQIQPRLIGQLEQGMCAMPLYRIASVPQPFSQFDALLAAQRSPTGAGASLDGVQVVKAYNVAGTYYVRQGHGHIAQAQARGQLFLQARVSECLLDRSGQPAQIIQVLAEAEREEFFRYYQLPLAHPAHECCSTVLGSFGELSKHIGHIQSLRQRPTTEPCALAFWYDQFYEPMLRLLRRCQIMAAFPYASEFDLYVWAAQHTQNAALPLETWPRQIRRNVVLLWLACQKPVSTE